MKIVNQYVKLKFEPDTSENILKRLERIARTCYDSERLIKENSSKKLIKKIIKSKHYSILEHESLTFEIKTNRKIANQLVRHRTGKFAQRSLRYVNESKNKDIEFILSRDELIDEDLMIHLNESGFFYNKMVEKHGVEFAGQFLPLCTATKIDFTIDLRNLRHFLELRCSKHTEPLMRELAIDILKICHENIEIIFDDLYEKFIEKPDEECWLLIHNYKGADNMKEINEKRLDEILELDLNKEDKNKIIKIILELIIEDEKITKHEFIPSFREKKMGYEPPYEVTTNTTNIQYYESPIETSENTIINKKHGSGKIS